MQNTAASPLASDGFVDWKKKEIARGIGCTQGLALVNTRGVVVGGIVGYFGVPVIKLGVNVAVVGAFAGDV